MAIGLGNARFVVAFVLLLLTCAPAEGQQADRMYRIGMVIPSTGHVTHAFLQSLRELGYVGGQNVIIEQRSTQGQSARFPELVAEIIGLKVNVLVVSGIFGALAAQKATTTGPIVFLGVADPVGQGVVVSLARPGRNITGTSLALGEGFAAKWVELLKEAAPKVTHVAVFLNSANSAAATSSFSSPIEPSSCNSPATDNCPRFTSSRTSWMTGASWPMGGESRRFVPPGCELCRPDSQGRQAGRSARRAAHEV